MKYLLLAIGTAFLSACSNGGSPVNTLTESGIATGIVGTWEIETMAMNGQKVVVERPHPDDPFRERNSSEWYQLEITPSSFALISTNFVSYSKMELPYKVEGKKIVTIDSENFIMTDFVLHSYTATTLSMEGVSEEGKATGLIWNFRRIPENALATKVAKRVDFEQSVFIQVTEDGKTPRVLDKTVKGEFDYRDVGRHDVIYCSLRKSGELRMTFTVAEIKENQTLEVTTKNDGAIIDFTDLKPNLSGPKRTQTFHAATNVILHSEGQYFEQSMSSCEQMIDRDGAVLNISSTCHDRKTNTEVVLKAVCLLDSRLW